MECLRRHVTGKVVPQTKQTEYTIFQRKKINSVPYFRLEMLENGTLWGSRDLSGSSSCGLGGGGGGGGGWRLLSDLACTVQ